MGSSHVYLVLLSIYIQYTQVQGDQFTTVVVWDGTSEFTDSSEPALSTGDDGSGEVTQPVSLTSTQWTDLSTENTETKDASTTTSVAPLTTANISVETNATLPIIITSVSSVTTETALNITAGSKQTTLSTAPLTTTDNTASFESHGTDTIPNSRSNVYALPTTVTDGHSEPVSTETPPEVQTKSFSISTLTSQTVEKATSSLATSYAVIKSDPTKDSTIPETQFSIQTTPDTSELESTSDASTTTEAESTTSASTSVQPTTLSITTISSAQPSSTSTTTSSTTSTPTTVTTTPLVNLGGPCSSKSDCGHIEHAVCKDVCRCKNKFYRAQDECRKGYLVKPRNVEAVLTHYTSTTITWKVLQPSDVQQVDISLMSARDNKTEITSNNHTSVTIGNLKFGTTYLVTVTAITGLKKRFSSSVNLTTRPSHVQSVKIQQEGNTLEIAWDPLSSLDDVIYYTVRANEDDLNTTSTNITYDGEYDTCYNVSVVASNSAGQGPWSRVHRASTESGVPASVTFLKAESTENSLSVSWTSPPSNTGEITGYTLTVRNQTALVYQTNLTCADCQTPCHRHTKVQPTVLTSTEFRSDQIKVTRNVTDLHPYTSYDVTVVAYTWHHAGPGITIHTQTQEAHPRKPVIEELVETARSVIVKWTVDGRLHGNSSYEVITCDKVSKAVTRTPCAESECTVGSLTPYWEYSVRVEARNSAGTTSSSTANVTTSAASSLVNVRVTEPSDVTESRSLTISWDQLRDRERHGVIKGHKVRVQCPALNKYAEYNEPGTELKLTTIEPECRYFINVSVTNQVGESPGVLKEFNTTAGAPPMSRATAEKSTVGVGDPQHEIALRIPSRILCDESQGKIRHWGVLVHRGGTHGQLGERFRGARSKYIVPSSLVAVNRSTSIPCREPAIYVNIGNGDCGGSVCSNNALSPDTGYRFVVFVCTSAGCTETFPSRTITTEREEVITIVVGVICGIVVSVILAALSYKLWKKVKSVRPSVHFDPGNIELGAKKVSLVSESQKSRPIKLHNLADHVDLLHRDSNLGFSEEYKALKSLSPQHPRKAAEQQACRTKNRYTNVLPFDHTRVKLLSQDDEEGSDYINANFLTGYTCKREYIAAQGPLPCTKDDFWRMIWEHRVGMVVMLTQCKERGRIKCEKYWPDNTDPVYFGDLIVQLRSESVLPDYVIRILDVKQGNKKRTVRHFHFLKWPDFGCPEKTWLLLNFVSAVRAHMPHHQEGPTLVHCSAGVGRTGTFVAVDVLLQEIKDSNEIDIFGLVLQMRESRPLMVQTENQYIYIHDCIRDALQEDTDEEGEEEEEEEDEHVYENA